MIEATVQPGLIVSCVEDKDHEVVSITTALENPQVIRIEEAQTVYLKLEVKNEV